MKETRGRPPVFVGQKRRHIISVIRSEGLTYAKMQLDKEGIKISLPTLSKISRDAGIKLQRGRKTIGETKTYVEEKSFCDTILSVFKIKSNLTFVELVLEIRKNGCDIACSAQFYKDVYEDLLKLIDEQKVKVKISEPPDSQIKTYSLMD